MLDHHLFCRREKKWMTWTSCFSFCYIIYICWVWKKNLPSLGFDVINHRFTVFFFEGFRFKAPVFNIWDPEVPFFFCWSFDQVWQLGLEDYSLSNMVNHHFAPVFGSIFLEHVSIQIRNTWGLVLGTTKHSDWMSGVCLPQVFGGETRFGRNKKKPQTTSSCGSLVSLVASGFGIH